jgi:FG-GAP-like repeat
MRPAIIPALLLCLCATITHAQDPAHATEFRKPTPGPGPNGAMQPTFIAHRLGNDHAEGITTLDMNNDGFLDILSGAYWYENPGAQGGDWKQHQYRTVGIHNEFVSDCGEWTVDVNHDGNPDVVTTGWISNGLWWYENPGKATSATAMWQKHFITDSYDTEGGAMADINGDGKPDIALAHYNHSGILWVDFSGPTPRVHHVGGKEQDGHGIGVGDIDGDGKPDILTPYGWFQNIDADNDKWQWHPDWRLGDSGFPILAYDVNNDGKTDIIYGQGHSYGLYWLEQTGTPDHRTFTRHTIDESFSQSHALKLVDLDGDGEPYLITGKRYRGHSGDDPGSYDPIVIYAYKIDRKNATFTRTPISINGTASVGTQIIAEDLDHDGDIDLATPGKLGVHFLENVRISNVPKATREAQQPIERKWPFPGEGQEVPQEDGPKN